MCDEYYFGDFIEIRGGWRVLSIDKGTNTVTIIHAGHPECYYHKNDSTTSITILNSRAVSEYLNDTYATGAHMMNYDEALAITGSEDATSNNLRKTRTYYWLTSPDGSYDLWRVDTSGRIENTREFGSFGIRPVVVLKSNIKTIGKTTDAVGQEAWSLVAP